MEHSPLRLSPVKDGRRVLGEKTPNASILSPSRNHKADAVKTTAVPMKPLREDLSPQVTGLSRYAGQKRTIDHVEEQIENTNSQESMSAALPPYEEQFHIFDESSQSTVKSATLATSQSEQELSAEPFAEQSAPSQPQTQQREISQPRMDLSPRPHTSSATVPSDPDARKAFIQQKASLLRGRIRTAMKHVKDPELDRRVSDLEAHSRKRLRFSMPASPTKEAEAAAAATEKQNATSPVKVPKLLPAPELKPTASSARYVSDIPSSPPASAGNEPHDDMPTPTQNNPHVEPLTPAAPIQLSSPPGTANREEKTEKKNNAEDEIQESRFENYVDYMVAKQNRDGVALDGLLQLMKTTDKYDALDTWTR
ncbi:hypothetical protein AOR_1_1128154 [Paecilomyces variotii No. 5]|uniref:Uncharacterized protein n=1 Tax=Byssochlamys spectabilis (strain No. 5 / NBRC 109023) TaxID=1356009 RepID=V5GAL2_BYSSN|nr:hypothetical protein AOR_1_1128154 [Paecilomyces variotii No. 5]